MDKISFSIFQAELSALTKWHYAHLHWDFLCILLVNGSQIINRLIHSATFIHEQKDYVPKQFVNALHAKGFIVILRQFKICGTSDFITINGWDFLPLLKQEKAFNFVQCTVASSDLWNVSIFSSIMNTNVHGVYAVCKTFIQTSSCFIAWSLV